MTFEMLNSEDNLLGGDSMNQTFNSNLSVRLAKAMQKHTNLQ